jgi:hypothetical protein
VLLAGVKTFPKQQLVMSLRVVRHARNHMKPQTFVEPRRLEAVRREQHLRAPSSPSLAFRGIYQRSSQTPVTPGFLYPYLPNLAAATPRVTAHPRHDLPAFVAHKHSEGAAVCNSRDGDIELIQTVLKKSYLFGRWVLLEGEPSIRHNLSQVG